jgi:hypothetical protein
VKAAGGRSIVLVVGAVILLACSSESPEVLQPQEPGADTLASPPAVEPPEPPERVQVPNFRGDRFRQALNEAEDLGLEASVIRRVSGRPTGTVLRQFPLAGTRRQPGARIRLVVAKPRPPPAFTLPPPSGTGGGCTGGYSPCLPPASDYDCAGGSGDGPEYTGTVTVTGSDPYGLDGDGDGVGCE